MARMKFVTTILLFLLPIRLQATIGNIIYHQQVELNFNRMKLQIVHCLIFHGFDFIIIYLWFKHFSAALECATFPDWIRVISKSLKRQSIVLQWHTLMLSCVWRMHLLHMCGCFALNITCQCTKSVCTCTKGS